MNHMKKTMLNGHTSAIPRPDLQPHNQFLDELKQVMGAEKHQLLLFPLLKAAATSLHLKNTMARCLDNVREHISRLEQVFALMGQRPASRQPESILAIGREAEERISGTEKGTSCQDAGLIVLAQQIGQYEIAAYGSLAQLARNLEKDDVLEILETTLNEEKEVDELLIALQDYVI